MKKECNNHKDDIRGRLPHKTFVHPNRKKRKDAVNVWKKTIKNKAGGLPSFVTNYKGYLKKKKKGKMLGWPS